MTNPVVVPGRWGVGWILAPLIRPQPTTRPVGWFADDKIPAVMESYSFGLSDPDTDAYADSCSVLTETVTVTDSTGGRADSRSTPTGSAVLSNIVAVPLTVTGIADSRSNVTGVVAFQLVFAADVDADAD